MIGRAAHCLVLGVATAFTLAGCGSSPDAWRDRAARTCDVSAARASAQARAGGRSGLAEAGTTLVARARGLRRADGPQELEALASTTEGVGRALRAYARAGDPGSLGAARSLEARAARQARALDLRGC